MARQITCVCGRRFHIGHSEDNVQCRKCGRWYAGHELSFVQTVVYTALGGEVARSRTRKVERKPSSGASHRGKQTDRQRPANNPVGSVMRWFFG